jgi:hypothetical protein
MGTDAERPAKSSRPGSGRHGGATMASVKQGDSPVPVQAVADFFIA